MRLKVTFLDGTEKVATIIPGDTVRFERQYNVSADTADADQRVEHVLFLAFVSLKRVGDSGTDDFDAFLDLVEDVDPVEEAPLEQPAA